MTRVNGFWLLKCWRNTKRQGSKSGKSKEEFHGVSCRRILRGLQDWSATFRLFVFNGERGRDAAVSLYFTELAGICVLMASGSLAHTPGALHSSHGAAPRRNQKRPRVQLVHGAFRNARSAGE